MSAVRQKRNETLRARLIWKQKRQAYARRLARTKTLSPASQAHN